MFDNLNVVQHGRVQIVNGQLVFGQYEIVRQLGVGSCGYVYLAKHKGLSDFQVALKVLFPALISGENKIDLKRLKSEISASYAVNHPNVIRCFEYVSDSQIAGFTMEYAAGGSLRKLMQNGRVHEIDKIVFILSSICEGLEAIHKAGIIHRDLKPENILFNSSGALKIADFSVAVSTDIQQAGSPVGTVDYICPEYLTEGKIDIRGDLYAVGAIIYQILTGDIPCQGQNPYHTLKLRMQGEPTPLLYLRPDCPLQLEHIVTKALQRDPKLRYQSAKEMLIDANELKNILTRRNTLKQSKPNSAQETTEQPSSATLENKNNFFGFIALFSLVALSLLLLCAL